MRGKSSPELHFPKAILTLRFRIFLFIVIRRGIVETLHSENVDEKCGARRCSFILQQCLDLCIVSCKWNIQNLELELPRWMLKCSLSLYYRPYIILPTHTVQRKTAPKCPYSHPVLLKHQVAFLFKGSIEEKNISCENYKPKLWSGKHLEDCGGICRK